MKPSLILSLPAHGPIGLQPAIPGEFNDWLLPNSEKGYCQQDFGEVLLQEMRSENVTLIYCIYKIKKDISLDFHFQSGLVLLTTVRKKNSNHYLIQGSGNLIQGNGKLYLAPGQFNILDASGLKGSYFLWHGREYHHIHLVYSARAMEKLTSLFPELKEWLTTGPYRPKLFLKANRPVTEEMKNAIGKILSCPFTDETAPFYLETLAKQALFFSLISTDTKAIPANRNGRLSPAINAVEEVKDFIDANFDQPITLKNMAQKVGLNEYKLNAMFKKKIGVGLPGYVTRVRMQAAHKMILENKMTLTEIAERFGYDRKITFSKAFERFFNFPPANLLRNERF